MSGSGRLFHVYGKSRCKTKKREPNLLPTGPGEKETGKRASSNKYFTHSKPEMDDEEGSQKRWG